MLCQTNHTKTELCLNLHLTEANSKLTHKIQFYTFEGKYALVMYVYLLVSQLLQHSMELKTKLCLSNDAEYLGVDTSIIR